MKKTLLKKYARLIAEVGVGVQKGQDVIVNAELDQPEFVRMVTEACYRAGARRVTVRWHDQPTDRLHFRYASTQTLSEVPAWEAERYRWEAGTLPCVIHLLSEDPDGLAGADADKMAESRQARYRVIKPFRDEMEGKHQWCIAAVPGRAWAKKVFPELRPAAAQEALWEAILSASRVTEDPCAAWEAHNRSLKSRCAYLNSLHIRSLHYTASNGTDLTVGMMPEARFCGGAETTLAGRVFQPNIPSEECFISPKRGRAEGIVYNTKPLSYEGQIIDGFWIRFRDGRAAECGAAKNEALLKKLLSMDEGAAYLGECALVPWESPINETGVLFYNTLFDENACCHLALGMGFIDTIEGYHDRSLEEMRAMGVNDSIIHEDFMIGTPDLTVEAETEDGKTVPVFRGGTWAF